MYRQLLIVVMGLVWCGSVTTEGESAPMAEAPMVAMPAPEQQSMPAPEVQPVQVPTVVLEQPHEVTAPEVHVQPEQTAAPVQAPNEEEPQGIDTLSLGEGSGNWLYKRIWWEKAEARYEKIKTLVDHILEAQMIFFARRAELARTVFDPFYINAGIGRGELQEILDYLMEQMNAHQQKKGELNEQERAFLSVMNKEKETLDQLKLDMDAINKLDVAVDESLGKLMEQLNLCRSYERQAWDDFKSIAKELSDKKARDLFYSMVTIEENVNAIGEYIKSDFTGYFNQLGTMAQDNITRIQSAINVLKEKGIDFKKKAQELEKKDENAERERRIREQEEQERAEQEAAAANTWFGWIASWFYGAWDGIVSLFSEIRGLFGSSSQESTEEAEEQVTPQAKEAATEPELPKE